MAWRRSSVRARLAPLNRSARKPRRAHAADNAREKQEPARTARGTDGVLTRIRAWLKAIATAAIGRAWWATNKVGEKAGLAASKPQASEVLANYTRGWVLFGVPDSPLTSFTWSLLPRRAVITADTAEVPKRVLSVQRRGEFEIRRDDDFETIVEACRDGRHGWLTPEAVEVYREVNELGFISTIGAYRDGRLVGGLWGIAVGRTLGIMSMFHRENHVGSLAVAALVEEVRDGGRWSVLDCGGEVSAHFKRFGAYEISAGQFSEMVWRSTLSAQPAGA
jgi:leucyl/phenylalanyl-tRNA---protein transferase